MPLSCTWISTDVARLVMVTFAQRGLGVFDDVADGLLNDSEHVNLRGFRNGVVDGGDVRCELDVAGPADPPNHALDGFRQPDRVELVGAQVVRDLCHFGVDPSPRARRFQPNASFTAVRSVAMSRLVSRRPLDDRHVLTERIVHLVRDSPSLAFLGVD